MNKQERRTRIESWRTGELQEENWDSYGGSPIHQRTIDVALLVSDGLGDDEWFPAPCSDGSVSFESEDATRWLFVEVTTYKQPPKTWETHGVSGCEAQGCRVDVKEEALE